MTCCKNLASNEAPHTETKTLRLEFLFLDETVCKPCSGTGRALEEAIEIVAKPLESSGRSLEINRVHIATRQDAISNRLIMSPTIRINGVDIDPDQTQGACGSCGDIAGGRTTVDCRTWTWCGEVHTSAPTGKIVEAILRSAIMRTETMVDCRASKDQPGEFALSENLEAFFVARESGEARCC